MYLNFLIYKKLIIFKHILYKKLIILDYLIISPHVVKDNETKGSLLIKQKEKMKAKLMILISRRVIYS